LSGCTNLVARNVRFSKAASDEYAFACLSAPGPDAQLAMSCVDDRGHNLPCGVDLSTRKRCEESRNGELHDLHRRGCGPPVPCLATPGMGRPDAAALAHNRHGNPLRIRGVTYPMGPRVQHTPTFQPKAGRGTAGGTPDSVVVRLDRLGYTWTAHYRTMRRVLAAGASPPTSRGWTSRGGLRIHLLPVEPLIPGQRQWPRVTSRGDCARADPAATRSTHRASWRRSSACHLPSIRLPTRQGQLPSTSSVIPLATNRPSRCAASCALGWQRPPDPMHTGWRCGGAAGEQSVR